MLIKTRLISTLRKTLKNKNNNHRKIVFGFTYHFLVLSNTRYFHYPVYFLQELEPKSEPPKKNPGAGQKRTSSATLIFDNHICILLFLAAKSYFFLFSRERYTLVTLTFSNSRALYNLNSL